MRLNVGGQTGGARDRLISQRFLPLRVPGCGSADESSTPLLPTNRGPILGRCKRFWRTAHRRNVPPDRVEKALPHRAPAEGERSAATSSDRCTRPAGGEQRGEHHDRESVARGADPLAGDQQGCVSGQWGWWPPFDPATTVADVQQWSLSESARPVARGRCRGGESRVDAGDHAVLPLRRRVHPCARLRAARRRIPRSGQFERAVRKARPRLTRRHVSGAHATRLVSGSGLGVVLPVTARALHTPFVSTAPLPA